MSNQDSLSFTEVAVADCEVAFSRLDHITRQIETNKAGIQRLVETDSDIRNDAGADAKKRISSLATNTAHLDLMRRDLAILERQAEAQQKRVIEVGKVALSKIMQVWSAIHRHCKAAAEVQLRETYDFNKLPIPVDQLAGCRFDVLLARQLQDRMFSIQFANPNGILEELRRLRELFDQASNAVADEPTLILNVARPEPAAAVPMSSMEELVEA